MKTNDTLKKNEISTNDSEIQKRERVIARPKSPGVDSNTRASQYNGFVMSNPLGEKKQVTRYIHSPPPAFMDYPKTQNSNLYELDEDEVLTSLKANGYPIYIKECGELNDFGNKLYVSDGISKGYYHWRNTQPVFISAQTGTGKNTFIELELIQTVYDMNYERKKTWNYEPVYDEKILILSNRIALRKQINERLGKIVGETAEVFSYQGLYDNELHWDEYSYVICDECHFFTSDAMFNPHTDLILDKLIRKLHKAVRIYMTSTFGTCMQYIMDKEREYTHNIGEEFRIIPDFLYYKFTRDYSYLNTKYFLKYDDLNDIITESVGAGEKWLIFIDHKRQCKELKNTLLPLINVKQVSNESSSSNDKNYNERTIMVIHSGSKGQDFYEDFILNEKFEQSILITTSVIDNGVNIKDSMVKHIVVTDINKDKVLQMIGRKRVDEGEIVNLYIQLTNIDYLDKLIKGLEVQKHAYHMYDGAYTNSSKQGLKDFQFKYFGGDTKDFKKALHWFYRDLDNPETVHPNKIARDLVENTLLPRYKYIKHRMEVTDSGQELLSQQLSWLNTTIDACEVIVPRYSEEAIANFELYLESLIGETIYYADQKVFRIEFFNEYVKAHGLRAEDLKNESRVKNEGYGPTTINEIINDSIVNMRLKKIPIKVEVNGKEESAFNWKFIGD